VLSDQPLGVVGVDEAGHGLAELVDSVVQLRPQALLLQGADPAFGAAVGLRLAQEGGVVGDPQPGDRAQEVARAVLGSPVVAQRQATSHVRIQPAPAVDDRVIDRLRGSEPSPTLATCAHASGEHPHPAVDPGPGHGGVGAPTPVRRRGMIVPSWGRGRRRPRARWGAGNPSRRSSRNTRLPLTCTPCSRRSRARTLR
jgi:hypothetical protein